MSDVFCTIGIVLVDPPFKNYHTGNFYAEIILKYATSNKLLMFVENFNHLFFIPAQFCQSQLL